MSVKIKKGSLKVNDNGEFKDIGVFVGDTRENIEAINEAGNAKISEINEASIAASDIIATDRSQVTDNTKILINAATDNVVVVPTIEEHNKLADDISAINDDLSTLSESITEISDWIGFAQNVIDCSKFSTTTPNNWSITSDRNYLRIVKNNTFSSGTPSMPLELSDGDYIFNADFENSSLKYFGLYVDSTYNTRVENGTQISIDNSHSYELRFAPSEVGNYEISNISLVKYGVSGEIQDINKRLSDDELRLAIHSSEIELVNYKMGAFQLYEVSGELDGVITEGQYIKNTGVLTSAVTTNYKTVKVAVEIGKTYTVVASTNYSNAYYAFYADDDSLVQVGTLCTSGSTTSSITEEITVPNGVKYIVVAYHTNGNRGSVSCVIGYKEQKWHGKKWVCVGDSLTAENSYTTKHYFDYISEMTGIETVNFGVSGSGYARKEDTNQAFYQRVTNIPSDADVVTIFGSFNDNGAISSLGKTWGNPTDTSTDTIAGCINKTIDTIIEKCPTAIIGVVAPTPWKNAIPATSGNDYTNVELIKAICQLRSIPFLDLWRGSNLRPWDADFRALAYSKDGDNGTHPNEYGHKILAPKFKAFLETLVL